MSPVRVLVADDHAVVRRGIVRILRDSREIEVVGEADDGAEATRKALETRPDVVVLDLSMPRLSGFEAARQIRSALPQTRILVLTMHDEDEYILSSVRAGASGYLLKDEAPAELVPGILALKNGRFYFAPSTFEALTRLCRANALEAEDPPANPAEGRGARLTRSTGSEASGGFRAAAGGSRYTLARFEEARCPTRPRSVRP
jgi:DNA-binding NarL/FixJ family response regulator